MRRTARATTGPDNERGAALLWSALLGTVLGVLGMVALHTTASAASDVAHTAAGSANVAQIVQAARLQQTVNGTTLHDELAGLVARCDCGVALDPIADVLTYRNEDTLVSYDANTSTTWTAPAGDTTLPEYSRPSPQLVIDLGGTGS